MREGPRGRLGDTEIEKLHAAVFEEPDVGWLDVAVNHAFTVCEMKSSQSSTARSSFLASVSGGPCRSR